MQNLYYFFEHGGKLLKIENYLSFYINMSILNIEIFIFIFSLLFPQENFKVE